MWSFELEMSCKWGYVKLESNVLTFAAIKLSLLRQTLLFSFSQMLNYLLHTLSWCLCLYFQCDISHSCGTFLSKWKAPDLEKMFSWQRMRSVVSASNPGRSSSANQFCLNWRHPLRFVVSSLFFSEPWTFANALWLRPSQRRDHERTLCFCINIGRIMQVKGCFTAVSSLCYYRHAEHW